MCFRGSIRLDDIGYDETRYVNAYADYREQQGGQPLVQRLYRLKGNRLYRIYPGLNQKGGRLILPDTAVHLVRVILTDVYGNSSELRFKAQRYFKDELAKENDQPFVDNPLPWLAAGKMNTISYSNMAFKLDETALYEDAPLWIGTSPADSGSVSLQFQIGNPDIPVHHNFELRLKPNRLIPFSLRTKVVMMYRAIRRENGRAATPEAEGWYQASVRELGKYRLVIDTTTPLVKPIAPIKGSLAKAVIIAFRATDNYTSVKSFRGELDRHWILFEQHGDVWTYVFDGHCRKGAHKLVIKAVDENGNEAAASYTFTR